MLLLTASTDAIQVVPSSAADLRCHASWVDNNAGTITPGLTNTAAITGTAATSIVAGPAASTQRNVRHLNIYNAHASASSFISIDHVTAATTSRLFSCTLLPGEAVSFNELGSFIHLDANGIAYPAGVAVPPNLGAAGTLAETIPREICPEVNTTMPASGTLFLQAIYLRAGQTISNITISSATTAVVTPTNQFYALYDANRSLLAQTANQTTTAWAANTPRTLPLTASYKVLVSGLYYIGYLMVATTIPTIKGGTARTGGQLGSLAPILHGASSTGLTTALPNPAAAITANSTTSIYAAVS